ncbi:DUF6320 domain-containing protein [Flavisolibacter tropicus]|uniref:Uncharacterized protein n=1 Tax=Flavisolibacter tropicus TaxID=1492898 RepID=A0A172TW04_9BACT|nr:DUF6320 domain-containing protein [Flavisolibacter tropicus]ANE50927.1 hypothetical protein SY85_10855 [Flavisolibacter tropicus]
MICKNCGVQLEETMQTCPLCGESAIGEKPSTSTFSLSYGKRHPSHLAAVQMSPPQKKFTWEIVSIILLSGALTTFVVDFILNRRITWSEYPLAICLTIFCYLSLFAFWNQPTLLKMTGGLLLASLCLVILDAVTGGLHWSVRLGIPLLLISNLIASALIVITRRSRYKGINLIAYIFLGVALICIAIEGVLSFFEMGWAQWHWSVIVAACIIPVVGVLLFVHFRLKEGRSLEKTFHV